MTVVASQLDVEGDGIAYFGGSGDALDGALTFKIAHANASLWISSAVLPDDNDRWMYSRSDLDEGDSMFAVSHAGKLAGLTRVSISIR